MTDPGRLTSPHPRFRIDGFTVAVAIVAACYSLLAWTPSSYGVQLLRLGLPGAGLVLGEPRAIREDEWIRWTSLVQATVNNGFHRTNETSLYREDLRNVEGLPLADWGLAFKPYYWLFFVTDAAHAFSFYHACWIFLFLVGYHHLFHTLGSPRSVAALASLALFFSSFAQTWWTTYGPVISGYPWILLLVLTPARGAVRGGLKVAAMGYAIAAWLLADLYPPIMITLAFASSIVIVAFRRELLGFRQVVPCVLGAALGGVLAFLYYRDVFFAMARTIYPGQRISGGGGVPALQWVAHIFPFFVTRGYHNLVNDNICEASTVGTYLPLLAVFFADPQALRAAIAAPGGAKLRWRLAVLTLGVLLTTAWLLLPLPAAAGMPLLWHRVPPFRMWFACGLLVFLLALSIVEAAPIRLSWPRLAGVAAMILGSWTLSGLLLGRSGEGWEAFTVLLPLGAIVAFRHRLAGASRPTVVAAAALANVVAFGMFNPIQSAKPMFYPPETPVTAALDRLAGRHPRGWLVLHGDNGAWLNGLGYKSATHVLYGPGPDTLQALFPDLPREESERLFNRTKYLMLWARSAFRLEECCGVTVPIEAFEPPTIPVHVTTLPGDGHEIGGAEYFRDVFVDDGGIYMIILGWGMFDGSRADSRLTVHTELPILRARAYPALSLDVPYKVGDPGLVMSGFALRLDLDGSVLGVPVGDGQDGAGERPRTGEDSDVLASLAASSICLTSEDAERGDFALTSAGCALPEPQS